MYALSLLPPFRPFNTYLHWLDVAIQLNDVRPSSTHKLLVRR